MRPPLAQPGIISVSCPPGTLVAFSVLRYPARRGGRCAHSPASRLAPMSGDLVQVRILAAFGSPRDRELLRQAAEMTAVPIEIIEADSAAAARNVLATHEIDVAFLDAASAPADVTSFISAARAAQPAPFVILVAAAAWGASELKPDALAPDGIVAKPAVIEQAKC